MSAISRRIADNLNYLIHKKFGHFGWGKQQEAALRLDIPQPSLNRILKGRTTPSPDTIAKLASGLGVPPERITGDVVPVLGIVSAGPGLDLPATADDFVPNPSSMFPDCVSYKVSGKSMVYAGILDGDYVLVRPSPSPAIGDVVLVWVPDAGTLIKVKRGRTYEPMDGESPAIPITEDCREYGVYVGVIRKLSGKRVR